MLLYQKHTKHYHTVDRFDSERWLSCDQVIFNVFCVFLINVCTRQDLRLEQNILQSYVNVTLDVHLVCHYVSRCFSKYQLSQTNPRDALHHGKRAANKGGRSV